MHEFPRGSTAFYYSMLGTATQPPTGIVPREAPLSQPTLLTVPHCFAQL